MSMSEAVGVVGYGAIGSRMARRLMAAGHPVVSHDIDRQAQEAALRDGAEPVENAAAVARRCAVVVTCVTDAKGVEACVAGDGGIAESITRGGLVIETTTSTPEATRRAAEALRTRGASIVDAPVSRGVPAAENGTLSIMIGGTEEDIAQAEPVLRHLGTDMIRTGPLGTGHIAKAMNMMVMGVNLLAAAEAIGLGVRAGLERTALVERMNQSEAACFMTTNHYVKHVLTGGFASTFTLSLMLKDLRVATEIARHQGLPALLGSAAEQVYALAAAQGTGAGDNMLIVPFVENLAGPVPASTTPALPAETADSLIGLLEAATLLATLEAAVIGERAGLSPSRLMDVLNVSSGASAASRTLAGQGPAPALEGLAQRARRAVALGRARCVPLPVGGSVADLLAMLLALRDPPIAQGANGARLRAALSRLMGTAK